MRKGDYVCDCNMIHKEIVEKTRKKMPSEETFVLLANFFKILGDYTRMRILFALDQNEMCVCDIANLLNMTKSSISHQLAILREAKVVRCRKDSKSVYYSLDDIHINQIFEVGLEHVIHQKKGDNL